jgi:putative transposase
LACSLEQKRLLVEAQNQQISQRRQCQLLGLNRATLYYLGVGESQENLHLMRLLDEQYTRFPFYGVLKMTQWLRSQHYQVNEKRVRRLLRKMGLMALYPKPNLSRAAVGHKVYPYLLRGVAIERVNQVWSTDITYVRLSKGFVYLVAIIDWFSRYVLSWELSVSLDTTFCMSALEKALLRQRPEIFNSDQGSQFTSLEFTGRLFKEGIKISMDGRGRALDNIFVERLWRSVKYEEVYLKEYRSVKDAIKGLERYFEFYNGERLHQALEYQTPEAVYRQGQKPAAVTTLN